MRLSTIKLAGFKSFVDPTTLHLPTNMTGVVGPNGCGKSNIIDAVRWVMGESSASRLRGDSLTDVIFSGSSARKPVGQATVELIFDNSDGALAGEFAAFNEISVKRTVSRDGSSIYALNGTRCRRRDITDLFLGTGLGPRSYSIIEQGMISQIIEARPEDLRVYLEEAAGISKYKERRRETETRIRHTRENLDRLNDLREEVDKQLEHLRRQARQAEQYQQLKGDQREKQAQLAALEWKRIDAELGRLRESIVAEEVRLEAHVADQRHAEQQIEACRTQQGEAQQQLAAVQEQSYRVGADIARLEQQIQHQREMLERLRRARDENSGNLEEVRSHLEGDSGQIEQLGAQLAAAEPSLAELRAREQQYGDQVQQAEQALAAWQARWDSLIQQQSEAGRAAEVGRARIEMLERQAADAARRGEQLRAEQGALDIEQLEVRLAELQRQYTEQHAALDGLGQQLDQRKAAVSELAEQQRQAHGELADVRKLTQSARGRLSSLEALQHAALGQESGGGLEWLKQRQLDRLPRLGHVIEVEAGWETAVEVVLAHLLEAVVVDDPAGWVAELEALAEGRVAMVDSAPGEFEPPAGSLAAKLRAPQAVLRLLADIDAVDGVESLQRHARSETARSAIDRAGRWVGCGWLRLGMSGDEQRGTLAREREIHALRDELETLFAREGALNTRLSELKSQLLEAEQQREDAQRSLYLAHRATSELSGQEQASRGKLEGAQVRSHKINEELAQLAEAAKLADEGIRESRSRQEQAVARMAELAEQRAAMEQERTQGQAQREEARQQLRSVRDQAHALALQVESQRSRLQALNQTVQRMAQQRSQLESRRGEIEAQLQQGDAPIAALERERQVALEQRVVVESDLATARSAVEAVDAEMRAQEMQRQKSDQSALALREKLQRQRLEEQAAVLKAAAFEEHIVEAGSQLNEVLAGMPEQADADRWRTALQDLEQRIRRLEPVNLAAIKEFGEQAQRKEYLDAQNNDLTTALTTLEDAIRKIDRETRGRFKDTFDRVNSGVQELYPRLFGGGHAYLELTGEDLLDTGVAIMARPPGKRVSNISLLSGGEKALTAVALVFAIFRLNPAPFCLLDEVDAPLDEANVGRFCQMVSEMSEKVQFLYVTHNKATMESARQLAGVTMREPGVSRLVSVDLDEAARLAGAA